MRATATAILVSLLLLLQVGLAGASEDYYTTDFQTEFQPPAGVDVFYAIRDALMPSDVKGSLLVQKYGASVVPVRGVQLFFVGQHHGFDLRRTNHYQFNTSGRDIGLRLSVLPERRNVVGVDVGVCQESNFPNHIFRNGADLRVESPSEDGVYGFVLLSKQVTPRLRLNGGVKWGHVEVGPLQGSALNWALGGEYALSRELSLAANFKQTRLEGVESNESIALRLNWRPEPSLRVQLEGAYDTRGLRGVLPVLEPYSDTGFTQRFANKGTASVGLNLSYRFDFAPRGRDNGAFPAPSKAAPKDAPTPAGSPSPAP